MCVYMCVRVSVRVSVFRPLRKFLPHMLPMWPAQLRSLAANQPQPCLVSNSLTYFSFLLVTCCLPSLPGEGNSTTSHQLSLGVTPLIWDTDPGGPP